MSLLSRDRRAYRSVDARRGAHHQICLWQMPEDLDDQERRIPAHRIWKRVLSLRAFIRLIDHPAPQVTFEPHCLPRLPQVGAIVTGLQRRLHRRVLPLRRLRTDLVASQGQSRVTGKAGHSLTETLVAHFRLDRIRAPVNKSTSRRRSSALGSTPRMCAADSCNAATIAAKPRRWA